jgi:hypothetical protein
MNLISLLHQSGVKGKPVVAGGFHAKYNLQALVGNVPDALHKQIEARTGILKAEGTLNDLSLVVNDDRLMITFGNVDSYDEHGSCTPL